MTMKKLILLLLFIPLISFGQDNFANEFVFKNEFVDASKELALGELFDSTTLLELSEAERLEAYNYNRQTFRLIVKKGSNDVVENIGIFKGEFSPSWELLDFLKINFEKSINAIVGEGMSVELLESGIKTLNGRHTYIYLHSLTTIGGVERFSNTYYISVNKKNFQISINTFNNLKLEDVISYVKY